MSHYTPEAAVFAEGPWTHRDVAANGARFHTVSAGDGPLVVLLHGFPMFWWTWRNVMVDLAEAGYRAVAMDLRGYGGSDHPPRGYDLFTLSRDVAGVIRSLGEPQATIIAHGVGGLVGWTAAALHPEVVDRLIVVSSPHPARMREAIFKDRAQLAASSYMLGFQRPWIPERQLVANDAERIELFLREWSADPTWPDSDAAARFRAAFQVTATAHCSIEFHRWAMRSLPRSDGRRFAAAVSKNLITAPVLHVHGAADRTVLPRSAVGSGRFVRGPYAWRTMTDVGHFPHEESPRRFLALVHDWMRSDPPWEDPDHTAPQVVGPF